MFCKQLENVHIIFSAIVWLEAAEVFILLDEQFVTVDDVVRVWADHKDLRHVVPLCALVFFVLQVQNAVIYLLYDPLVRVT